MIQRTTIKRAVIGALLLACCVFLQGTARAAVGRQADGPRDMVWSAADGLGKQAISFSTWKSGRWSEPVQVTSDNADNYTPCIEAGPDGKKYLVWTAYDEYGQNIRYAVFEDGKWSAARKIPGLPPTSGAPFVAVDDRGRVWVVFLGNDGEDDEIYWTRLENGAWTESRRVHADNDTPDIHPYVEITRDSRVVVTWQGYRGEGYATLRSVWGGDGWQAETVVPEDARQAEVTEAAGADTQADQLPAFVTDKRQVFTRTYDK